MTNLIPHGYALYGLAGTAVCFVAFHNIRTWVKNMKVDPPAKICLCENRLKGKTVVITGATSGIGKEVALQSAKLGARVIIGCRNKEKGEKVKQEIKKKTNGAVDIFHCDLSSLQSCKDFALTVKDTYKKINFLVNNAAIFNLPSELTEDKLENTWQTNFLGHIVITENLLDALEKEETVGKKAIIFTGSGASHLVDVKNLVDKLPQCLSEVVDLPEFEDSIEHYGYTKLALWNYAMFNAIYLPQEDSYSELEVFCVDPGSTWTNIFGDTWKFNLLKRFKNRIGMRTPYEACQTIMHCMNKPSTLEQTGQFLKDCEVIKEVDVDNYAHINSIMNMVYPFLKNYVDRLISLPNSVFPSRESSANSSFSNSPDSAISSC